MISFVEFKKQLELGYKLAKKFSLGRLTEEERQKWTALDPKVKEIVNREITLNKVEIQTNYI